MPHKFMLGTFRHGTHPPASKGTADIPLSPAEVPEEIRLPLSQHIGAPAREIVSVGDRVLEGQLVAEPSGYVSAAVHSPVSGIVRGFVTLPTATGGKCRHIVIENDFLYEKSFLAPLPEDADAEAIKARIAEAGIVGMGGAGFPTHIKLSPRGGADILVVNGAECEPYITCDCRLMTEKAEEVADGVRLLKRALGAEKAFIAVEDNKREAVAALRPFEGDGLEVVRLRVKYPQGAEKQLIYAVTGRKVPPGALPADVGCVVDNVHTAYAVSRAVRCGEPLYMRALTVAGGGVEKQGNFWVRTGTPFSFVYEKTRGDLAETVTDKVISGGPMMGFAQAGLEACCTKTTSALLFLDAKQISRAAATECINCGRCFRSCPMFLSPREIEHAVLDEDFARAEKLNVNACIECGTCSYVCPAKRPLVQAVRLAKKTLRKGGGK